MGLVAKQISPFYTKGSYFSQVSLVVQLIVIIALVYVSHKDLFPEVAFFRILEEGDHARLMDSKHPFALMPPFFCCFFGSGYRRLRQPGQVFFVINDHFKAIVFFQNILAKLHCKNG